MIKLSGLDASRVEHGRASGRACTPPAAATASRPGLHARPDTGQLPLDGRGHRPNERMERYLMSGDKAIRWSTVAVVAAVAAVAAVVSYRHAQQVVTHYAETGLLERCCLSRSTWLSIAPRWRCCTLPATSPACQRWHG